MTQSMEVVPLVRVAMEVVPESGQAVPVEFRITAGTVEVWVGQACCAALGRDELRAWIGEPAGSLAVRGAVFTLPQSATAETVLALSIPDQGVQDWVLSPAALHCLRRAL